MKKKTKEAETAKPEKNKGRFTGKTKMQCRVYFVDERMTIEQTSERMGGKPSKSCISIWAKKRDRNGKNWYDYRYEKDEELYRALSPNERALQIHRRLDELLNSKMGDPGKFARAIRQMTSSINEIVDPRMNLPVIFQTMDDLLGHVERLHKDASQECKAFLAEVFRTFSREVRERIEGLIPDPPAGSGENGAGAPARNTLNSYKEPVQNDSERFGS